MASSPLVIKVKFGETLRRLTVSLHNNALSFNIAMLKEKICSIMSFGSNVMFTMTYADEDGDMITLATEDDLRDILRQSINPLRITVDLNKCIPVGSSVGVTTSAPMTLTPSQLQSQNRTPVGSSVGATSSAPVKLQSQNGTPAGSSVGATSSASVTLTPIQKQLQQQYQQQQKQKQLQQQHHQQHQQQQQLQQQLPWQQQQYQQQHLQQQLLPQQQQQLQLQLLARQQLQLQQNLQQSIQNLQKIQQFLQQIVQKDVQQENSLLNGQELGNIYQLQKQPFPQQPQLAINSQVSGKLNNESGKRF